MVVEVPESFAIRVARGEVSLHSKPRKLLVKNWKTEQLVAK